MVAAGTFLLLQLAAYWLMGEHPGPKSGHGPQHLGVYSQSFWSMRGEGFLRSTTKEGGDQVGHVPPSSLQKNRGIGQKVGPIGAKGLSSTWSTKKSYRKAVHRLLRDGCTSYKGRLLMTSPQPHNLTPTLAGPMPSSMTCGSMQPSTWTTFPFLDRAADRRKKVGGPRCSFLSWNAGGLTSATWQELMQYLSHHAVDIACVQGTRWNMTKDWSTYGYWALSAGTEDRRDHDGLLTLIHHRLCGQQDI